MILERIERKIRAHLNKLNKEGRSEARRAGKRRTSVGTEDTAVNCHRHSTQQSNQHPMQVGERVCFQGALLLWSNNKMQL